MTNEKFDAATHYDDVLFLPLGGTNAIGANLSVYHYKGKWIIIDFGLGFAGAEIPGVDVILPKIRFLESIKNDILGIIITHSHEDHIGGLQYLWSRLGNIPIYATPLASELIKVKFDEIGIQCDNIHVVRDGDASIDLSPFSIRFMHVTHSVAETNMIVIKTDAGNILHTGDWRFDDCPIVGDVTDKSKFIALGQDGILAMMCDSTNIFRSNPAPSEGALAKSLEEIILSRTSGAILVTTFASNIARLCSLSSIAQKCNRRIVLAGRSLWRLYNAASTLGYFSGYQEFLPLTALSSLKRHEIMMVCTGCQGESAAVASRIVSKTYKHFSVHPGDAVIFASKIIPGNEKKIYALLNGFVKIGIEMFSENDHFVHVSGHSSRNEIIELYEMIKPQIAIPVHGEPIHLHEHCKLARSMDGVKYAIEAFDGAVICLDPNNCRIVGNVDSGHLAVDGHYIVDENSLLFKQRCTMRDGGCLIINVTLRNDGTVSLYNIFGPGILDNNKDGNIIEILQKRISGEVKRLRKANEQSASKAITEVALDVIGSERGKRPYVVVNVIRTHNR